MQRTNIQLAPAFVTAVQRLNDTFTAPPSDELWDDAALDQHPAWATARQRATELLARLPPT